MLDTISYSPRFSPPNDEVRRKLELSQKEVEGLQRFQINCPICNFPLEEVFGEKRGFVSIKCNKCKFAGPLNLAYFRRQKKTYRYFCFDSKKPIMR